MKVGADALPQTGESATTLGIRPRDIPDGVGPELGGMSVTPERGTLPNLTGNNLETFCIACRNLGPKLTFRIDPLDPTNHGFVEAIRAMSKEEFEQALFETRPNWKIYNQK